MHRAHHYLASLFLTAALAAPLSSIAAPTPQDDHDRQNRVYDKKHRDYHNWDDNENRSWNRYLTENHRQSHEYSRANRREQSSYWNWRHAHSDDRDHRDNDRH